jgi:hypothetical protein
MVPRQNRLTALVNKLNCLTYTFRRFFLLVFQTDKSRFEKLFKTNDQDQFYKYILIATKSEKQVTFSLISSVLSIYTLVESNILAEQFNNCVII